MLRATLACTSPGTSRSAVYCAVPVTFAGPSTRATSVPTTFMRALLSERLLPAPAAPEPRRCAACNRPARADHRSDPLLLPLRRPSPETDPPRSFARAQDLPPCE